MTSRIIAFVALAAVLGAVFVRLGIWQLERRSERRAQNERVTELLSRAPVPITDVIREPDAVNRRAWVAGVADFENELVVTGRSHSGSPGVHLVTPMRLPGRDTAVLVNRGWVYSPDAAMVDPNRWRETRASFTGFTQRLVARQPEAAQGRGRAIRQLTPTTVARLLPYPVYDVYLVARDSGRGDSIPVRLDTPLLNDGPHLSYAIQWFAFATIAWIGAAVVVQRARRSPRDGAQLAKNE